MTSQQVDKLLREAREAATTEFFKIQTKLDELYREASGVNHDFQIKLRNIVADSGYIWCIKCGGTGAIERLDRAIMSRFGLREWDGCPDCGGDNETRGKGYYAKRGIRP